MFPSLRWCRRLTGSLELNKKHHAFRSNKHTIRHSHSLRRSEFVYKVSQLFRMVAHSFFNLFF